MCISPKYSGTCPKSWNIQNIIKFKFTTAWKRFQGLDEKKIRYEYLACHLKLNKHAVHKFVWNLGFVICNFPEGAYPCFTGRTTSTFQMLPGITQALLVSILVLLEEPLQLRNKFPSNGESLEFQSLFYWKNHFNYQNWKAGKGLGRVSILVLLEEPLQHQIGAIWCMCHRVSILVLLEEPL